MTRPWSRVVGLDLSLTSTGISDGYQYEVVQTNSGQRTEERLDRLTRAVVRYVLSGDLPVLAVIEGSSFGSRGPGHEETATLRLMVRHRLWRLAIPFAIVPPTTLKLFTTGEGRASKQQMAEAMRGVFRGDIGSIKVKDGRYDVADATALAAMGYHHIGFPCSDPARPDAADKVEWPDLISD